MAASGGDHTAKLARRLARENRAREEAELLLEAKSLELFHANESLKAANERLEEAVKERTHALEDALRDAQRANDVKSQFLATMSHELRTPLNGILGMIELARTNTEDAEQAEFLDHAARSGETLAALLGDLLDITKIESDQIDLNISQFDLHRFVQDLQQMFRGQADEKGLEFRVGIDTVPLGLSIEADRVRLYQVVWNLITNAIKFTDAGFVKIEFEHRSSAAPVPSLHVRVTDTGIGIPADRHDQIFDRFVQLGHDYRKNKGTGLGLSICQRLVTLMGGEMTLDSTEGQGSSFAFWVPAKAFEPSSVDVIPNRFGANQAADTTSAAVPANIAVIDDSPANVLLAKVALEKAGYSVQTAPNGVEGLALLQRTSMDLILLDLSMPDMDGFEVLRRLRHEAVGPNSATQVIALTAHVLPGTRAKVSERGFDGFLGKPLKPADLVAAVGRYIAAV